MDTKKCLTNGCFNQIPAEQLVRFCDECRVEYGKFKRAHWAEAEHHDARRDPSPIPGKLRDGFEALGTDGE